MAGLSGGVANREGMVAAADSAFVERVAGTQRRDQVPQAVMRGAHEPVIGRHTHDREAVAKLPGREWRSTVT